MAIQLPSELQFVLDLLGLKWPQANEDELIELANQLKKLASQIDSTQMAADKALGKLAEVYHGAAADKLAEVWRDISKYAEIITEALETAAKALTAAAVVIEVCKGQAITQLVSIQAQLAAATGTGGWSTGAVIRLGKEILGKLLDEAVGRLAKELAEPIAHLAEKAVAKVTGGSSVVSVGQGFGVDLGQMAACAVDLRRHADDLDAHGSGFRRVIEGLDVGKPGDAFGKLAIAAAKEIARAVGVEVLNRILSSFRGTADRMDQVVRNMSENEDAHTQQMNGGYLGGLSLFHPGGTKLAGGVPGGPFGGGRDVGLTAFDGLRPHLGGSGGAGSHAAASGLAGGAGGFGGAAGSLGAAAAVGGAFAAGAGRAGAPGIGSMRLGQPLASGELAGRGPGSGAGSRAGGTRSGTDSGSGRQSEAAAAGRQTGAAPAPGMFGAFGHAGMGGSHGSGARPSGHGRSAGPTGGDRRSRREEDAQAAERREYPADEVLEVEELPVWHGLTLGPVRRPATA
ncbi:hypothetical protein [Kitasatospora camelliae]|uniref:Outer membrane channel protein CpnT-like N-terminal domain-containing protein n=1 Tax=Kitasatospora camelliae TaxID=3156397 RepID=A0AAU8JSC1_9ACTN